MRLFGIFPNSKAISAAEDVPNLDRVAIEAIADLIVSHISSDPALFAMQHIDEVSEASIALDQSYGHARVAYIADTKILRKILLEAGDPNSGKSVLIRSLITCRSVMYGHDGQAFVCLPSSAPAIFSPDADVISVEDLSQMILETDYMDGLFSEEETEVWSQVASLMAQIQPVTKTH
jgi:hypothetical protein